MLISEMRTSKIYLNGTCLGLFICFLQFSWIVYRVLSETELGMQGAWVGCIVKIVNLNRVFHNLHTMSLALLSADLGEKKKKEREN